MTDTAPRSFDSRHANETHANAVDFSLLEPSKENIQPLRGGRDPHALLKAINANGAAATVKKENQSTDTQSGSSVGVASGHTSASMKADRKKFEEAIKSYPADGAAPLTPWINYIQWTQQSYLAATAKSHLLPLLEKCTRTFLKDARVNTSLRYLQIWFLYMDLVEDSLDLFSFLHTNQVCTNHAALYEGWSKVLEQRGRVQDAQDTLKLGQAMGAQPASNLRNSLVRLEARVAKAIAQSVAKGEDLSLTQAQRTSQTAQRMADENGTVMRQPLQRISAQASSGREALFEAPVNGQTIYPNSRPAPSNPITGRGQAKFSATASNFQIFCDDPTPTAESTTGGVFNNILGPAEKPAAPQWNEYRASQVGKENRAAAGTWSAPLHPAASVGGSSVSEGAIVTLPIQVTQQFPVFVDPECAAEDAARAAAAAAPADLRKKLDGPLKATNLEKSSTATMAKLQSNPLRNMKAATSSSSSSAPTAPPAPKP